MMEIKQIERALFNRFCPSSNAYLLLDMHAPQPLTELLSSCPPERTAHLIHPDFVAQPNKAPLLVQLKDRHDFLLEASIELAVNQVTSLDCTFRQVGGWLFSDHSLPEFARRLGARLTVRHGQGQSRWRLHDSRVIAHLPTLLQPEQMYQLLWDVQDWYYLDEGAQLQQIEHPTLAQPPALKAISMSVNQHQLESLRRIETVNAVIQLLKSMGLHHSNNWIAELHAQVVHAKDHGLTDPTDQMVYAAHGVCIHPNFDHHPLIGQAIYKTRAQGASFCDVMNCIDQSALAAIADDLNRNDGAFQQGVNHE